MQRPQTLAEVAEIARSHSSEFAMALDEFCDEFYLDHPEAMPKSYSEQAQHGPRHRVVCDYIAGMTDHFLLRQHQYLLGASSASVVS